LAARAQAVFSLGFGAIRTPFGYTRRVAAAVLIVEDEVHQARALQGLLELDGHEVDLAHDGAAALAQVVKRPYELVLCDLRLPDQDGLEIFRRVRERLGQAVPTFVIMTAYGTVETARLALKGGVFDYITKPVDPTELAALVDHVSERARLRRENEQLSQEVDRRSIHERLIGASPPFAEMRELAEAAAESEATILIRGESGTGKELVAELVHAVSPRRDGPFVKVNCSAIPEPLLEAELFGHERGAFTDARRSRKGRFERANGGTIFLDEVGDMSTALQVKLLRVLQEREVERLGGQGKVIPLDIRLVAATNRDLDAMVKAGTFREDLFYRINVITIEVPPLRDRVGDLELLATQFCLRFSEKNSKTFTGISPPALEKLRRHDWPGNVRDVVERAVVLGQGPQLLPSHLGAFDRAGSKPTGSDDLIEVALDSTLPLEAFEREIILQALERTDRNVTQAARLLGITRRTLQYRMEKHDISKEAIPG
jgi:two-component system response regulator HydG